MTKEIRSAIVMAIVIYIGAISKTIIDSNFRWEVAVFAIVGYGYGIKRLSDGSRGIGMTLCIITTVLLVAVALKITLG